MKIFKRIMLVLIIITIIAGMVIIGLKGFNYGLLYSKSQRMNIYIDKDFEINDIKYSVKEVLGDNAQVQYGTHFNTVASIVSKEISDEQQDSIINKIQDKLDTEIDKENDIVIMDIPQIEFYDVIGGYILPIVIITLIFTLFLAVIYRKQGVINTILKPLLSIVIALGFYASIYALVRIPVNELFTSIGVLVYILVLVFNAIKLNKSIKE